MIRIWNQDAVVVNIKNALPGSDVDNNCFHREVGIMLALGIFKIIKISFKLIYDIIIIKSVLILISTIVVIVVVTGIAEFIFS